METNHVFARCESTDVIDECRERCKLPMGHPGEHESPDGEGWGPLEPDDERLRRIAAGLESVIPATDFDWRNEARWLLDKLELSPKDKEVVREMRRALEAATPEPWKAQYGHIKHGRRTIAMIDTPSADADLIANAPTWLRWLLDKLEGRR